MKNIDKLQQLLGMDKSNPFFEIYFNPDVADELLVYYGFQLLETVPAKSFQEKLLLARLTNAGYNQRVLQEKFCYDTKTMRRWGMLLKSGKAEDISKIAEGQGAKRKLTEEKLKFIFYLFNKNYEEKDCHILSFIKEEYETTYQEKISKESLRTLLKPERDRFKEAPPSPSLLKYPLILYSEERNMREKIAGYFTVATSDSEPKNPVIRVNTCKNIELLSSNETKKSKYSPELSTFEQDNYPLIGTLTKEIFSCYHIGILLARIYIDSISFGLVEIRDIVRQWVCMILSGCQNIEQGQTLNYPALELLVGKQISSANHQRKTLKKIANKANVRLLFKKNIELIGAGDQSTFLLDPHGIPYTGQLKTLLCWLGAIHQTGKGHYLDLIHTTDGEPVFSKIDDNYYDLRQRFHSVIKEFRRILAGDKNRVLTIIIDRAIYDVNFMREARCEDIHIITWEKNYRKGQWDKVSKLPVREFHIQKYRNSKEDSYVYQVTYVKRRWEKELSFAQYIIQLTKPGKEAIELSVICTDYERNPEETLLPILQRWLQENDMKYLIMLGINCITSYDYVSYADIVNTVVDRQMKNKELSKLISEKNKLKNKLGAKMLERELYIERKEDEKQRTEKELYDKENQLQKTQDNKAIEKQVRKLKAQIKRIPRDMEVSLKNNENKQIDLREKISALEEEILPILPYVSRIETLIQEEYVKLNFMPKSFMDVIKIISRNIIYELMKIFRPIWNNYRNDHVILRELLSSIGFIQDTEKHIYIRLTPSRMFSKKQKQKILLFLFEISKVVNNKYKNEKIIIITLNEL